MARATRRSVVKSPGMQGGVGHGVVKKNFKDSKKDTTPSAKKIRGALGEITNNPNVVGQLSKKNKETVKVEPKIEEDIKSEEEDPEMDGLCEYERIRLTNIRERQAMFAELDLNKSKSDYTISTTPKPRSAVSKRGIAGEGRPKEVLPTRQKSARIAGGKVAEIERFDPLVNEPDEPEVVLETIKMKDSLKNADDMKEALAASFLIKMGENCFKEEQAAGTHSLKVNNLSLSEEGVAKVTPGRIFSMAVNPSPINLVVAAGDKWGAIGLWDINNTSAPAHGVHLFSPHTKPVNCLSWDMANSANLISTSYDGTVKLLDCEKQEFSLLYAEEEYISWGGWTSFHTQIDRETLLVSKGSTGSVALVDRRAGWSKPSAIYQLFHKTHAKSIFIHPNRPELLLAGNNKAECCIFDLRTGTDSKVMNRFSSLTGHARSVNSCNFNPQGDQVVTIAADDRIRLYDTSSLKPDMGPRCAIRHNNHTGRWLSPFRVCWDPSRRNVFYTGSMDKPRTVEVWGSEGGNLVMQKNFRHDLLSSVCSIINVHPSMDVVIGGNSSGRVHCFM